MSKWEKLLELKAIEDAEKADQAEEFKKQDEYEKLSTPAKLFDAAKEGLNLLNPVPIVKTGYRTIKKNQLRKDIKEIEEAEKSPMDLKKLKELRNNFVNPEDEKGK